MYDEEESIRRKKSIPGRIVSDQDRFVSMVVTLDLKLSSIRVWWYLTLKLYLALWVSQK